MDTVQLLFPLVAALAGAGVGAALTRRAMRPRLDAAEADLARLADALRRQERSTAEDRAVQDLVLRSMQEGVLLLDPAGEVAFANDAFVRHLGSPPAALHALLPLALRDAILSALADRAVTSVLVETGSPSRWLRATATPAGEDGAVLVVLRDVTEAMKIDSIRRDFVANASHELKTPAASIQAAAETLKHAAADDPAAVRRFAAQLEREAVRLSRIVADLLDLSRLESGSDLSEHVHLDTLIREEVQRFEDIARESELTLRVAALDVAAVDGSGRDLSLLVRNLIDNAIRHSHPGGQVDVSVTPENGVAVLRVTDTGVGIPSKELSRIFERFYRVDRARSRETGGTGLGLAIVKHVTENHGGTVRVESELGRGTTFEVRLPRATTR
jgi:two-component system, OmpR family, sensor histidine kinase SenX3